MKTSARQIRSKERQIEELLTSVFLICSLDTTLAPEALDQLINVSRRKASRRGAALGLQRHKGVDFDVLGHVVYLWQRTTLYLDDGGLPKPIPAFGKAPSIECLFKDVRRLHYLKQGIKDLLTLKRIKRTPSGKYVPCSEVTIVPGLTPEFVELTSQTINRLVATVLQNTAQRDPDAIRLVERVTAVPDLPVKQIQAFRLFAREQGGALINTMNEWLESRRGTRKPRAARTSKHATAGLHVFAFVEKGPT
jgi:hypothetical protein